MTSQHMLQSCHRSNACFNANDNDNKWFVCILLTYSELNWLRLLMSSFYARRSKRKTNGLNRKRLFNVNGRMYGEKSIFIMFFITNIHIYSKRNNYKEFSLYVRALLIFFFLCFSFVFFSFLFVLSFCSHYHTDNDR